MTFKTFTVGPFAENTYLISEGGSAILIDPGFSNRDEFATFQSALADLDLLAVILTHAHVDHLLGLHVIRRTFELPVYLNHSDLYLWENFESQSALFGIRTKGFDFVPEPLPSDEPFSIGPFQMELLYTPGHSPDHISIYFREEEKLIAGDALFRESIGRTDLYKGDFQCLESSIREKLYRLPDQTLVLPGHGPSTTIGHEKRNNPFVKP